MKLRLSILYFLQFAIWGCYLSSFGQMLGGGGLGSQISWFYAAVGLVSLLTPAIGGHLADRLLPSRNMLGICHLVAASVMTVAWLYTDTHPKLEFGCFFPIYCGFLAFYMPTLALANTTTFSILKKNGKEPVNAFPGIRIWGTIGFIAAMWFVNTAYFYDGHFGFTLSDTHPAAFHRFQYTGMQLFASAAAGFLTALYTLTLPKTDIPGGKGKVGIAEIFGFNSFRLFKEKKVAIFLCFAILTGVCLQISNGYAIPYINHFMGVREYADSPVAANATLLFSLSQISEAFCILLVGTALRKLGFRIVIFLALAAWALRFLLLGLGNPGNGVWMLASSMLIYGIAFNFFNISGHIYMERVSGKENKGFGQGLLMMMSNGVGATSGMIAAGAIVNHYCHWEQSATSGMRFFMGDWIMPWCIFAAYAILVGLMFIIFYKDGNTDFRKTHTSHPFKSPKQTSISNL